MRRLGLIVAGLLVLAACSGSGGSDSGASPQTLEEVKVALVDDGASCGEIAPPEDETSIEFGEDVVAEMVCDVGDRDLTVSVFDSARSRETEMAEALDALARGHAEDGAPIRSREGRAMDGGKRKAQDDRKTRSDLGL